MSLGTLSIEVIAAFGGLQIVLTGPVAFVGRVWLNSIQEKDRAHVEATLNALRTERERDASVVNAAKTGSGMYYCIIDRVGSVLGTV